MIFKSSWMVLFSFTISAFIKKSTSFFFQKVNWKNLSRNVRPGKRIRSSHLFLCIIVEFIHQKRGQQTQEGDVADMALWHQVSFPLFPRQKASSSSHRSTTCWWWTLPTFILPSNSLTQLYLNSTHPHTALNTQLHHHPQEKKLGSTTQERIGRQQAQLQISLKHGQGQDILGPAANTTYVLLQPHFRCCSRAVPDTVHTLRKCQRSLKLLCT